jgi:hypothetical protein
MVTLDTELDGLVCELAALRGVSAARVVADLAATYRDELRDTVSRLRLDRRRQRTAERVRAHRERRKRAINAR